eukprot:RCo011273
MVFQGLHNLSLGLVAALLLGTMAEANLQREFLCDKDLGECNNYCRQYLSKDCVECPFISGEWTCPFATAALSTDAAKAARAPAPRGQVCLYPSAPLCNDYCRQHFKKDCEPCRHIAGWWGCDETAVVKAAPAPAAPGPVFP